MTISASLCTNLITVICNSKHPSPFEHWYLALRHLCKTGMNQGDAPYATYVREVVCEAVVVGLSSNTHCYEQL